LRVLARSSIVMLGAMPRRPNAMAAAPKRFLPRRTMSCRSSRPLTEEVQIGKTIPRIIGFVALGKVARAIRISITEGSADESENHPSRCDGGSFSGSQGEGIPHRRTEWLCLWRRSEGHR